ncbi:sigma 54-interacting transcriptional regulator [Clostridium sp. SYSU_GA19001]|uniref:sigma-54 interaction domain-containing protein n=1 Tax=Clostridium caldaquaticum TaxID=2940653 RepID=UPI0020770A03|nr:sigma 54-interacting transcriptional regulator [Clostridium caldaquaticum]MCM8711219.1 sigma 54-interacting transcriptional regulator [Clostridium caldaquaticum]
MDKECFLKIGCKLKERLDTLVEKTGLDINKLLFKLIENNNVFEEKLKIIMEENMFLRQRELNVFEAADAMSDGVYLSDENGFVIAANSRYSEVTGISADEIIGKNMQTILNEKYLKGEYVTLKAGHLIEGDIMEVQNEIEPYIVEKPVAICSMVLQQKKEVSVMGTLIAKGKKKVVLFIGKPYFDEQGKIKYVLVLMRETTELIKLKDKLEEAEKKSREYLNELINLKSSQREDKLIGKDYSIEKIRQTISYVAKTDATVLITGETGVGKEVVAREIYKNSLRKNGPYIKVNCAAIPESLLESELFGYEKGAFTGAMKKEKLGYFEMANGGTILLDEIGEMPVKLQSKLLRVLQEREITRIGGTKTISLDIRVIASTNQDLEQQIKNGRFREDLYYRLNVIPIKIPPLRERKADIALLAYNFLEKFTERYNKSKEFEASAIEILSCYQWPGNVRELENAIERLVIIGDERFITDKDVINVLGKDKFSYIAADNEETTLKEAVNKLEKTIIEKALKKYKSSHKAAKVLGITQTTVLRKAKALGIKKW